MAPIESRGALNATLGEVTLQGQGSSRPVGVHLQMDPAAFESLNQMSLATGIPMDQVMSKALALFRVAAEAHLQGKAVGIAGNPDVLETEFVGFGRPE